MARGRGPAIYFGYDLEPCFLSYAGRLRAAVISRGAFGSHAAQLCGELGIPLLVEAAGAGRVRDGETAAVSGDSQPGFYMADSGGQGGIIIDDMRAAACQRRTCEHRRKHGSAGQTGDRDPGPKRSTMLGKGEDRKHCRRALADREAKSEDLLGR